MVSSLGLRIWVLSLFWATLSSCCSVLSCGGMFSGVVVGVKVKRAVTTTGLLAAGADSPAAHPTVSLSLCCGWNGDLCRACLVLPLPLRGPVYNPIVASFSFVCFVQFYDSFLVGGWVSWVLCVWWPEPLVSPTFFLIVLFLIYLSVVRCLFSFMGRIKIDNKSNKTFSKECSSEKPQIYLNKFRSLFFFRD